MGKKVLRDYQDSGDIGTENRPAFFNVTQFIVNASSGLWRFAPLVLASEHERSEIFAREFYGYFHGSEEMRSAALFLKFYDPDPLKTAQAICEILDLFGAMFYGHKLDENNDETLKTLYAFLDKLNDAAIHGMQFLEQQNTDRVRTTHENA